MQLIPSLSLPDSLQPCSSWWLWWKACACVRNKQGLQLDQDIKQLKMGVNECQPFCLRCQFKCIYMPYITSNTKCNITRDLSAMVMVWLIWCKWPLKIKVQCTERQFTLNQWMLKHLSSVKLHVRDAGLVGNPALCRWNTNQFGSLTILGLRRPRGEICNQSHRRHYCCCQ